MPSSRICKIASKSMVIVADSADADAYCCGCVMVKDMTITVIAPSKFVTGREDRLKVIFFDKKMLDATLVAKDDSFCSLRTAFHSACEICVLEDVAQPGPTFMFVPESRSSWQKRPTYANVETLQSFKNDEKILIANSAKYFVVSCDYLQKNRGGVERLSGAPVFTMSGKTAGIILQDYREDVIDPGSRMKVALKSKHLRELMLFLDPPAKRKRGTISPAASGRRG